MMLGTRQNSGVNAARPAACDVGAWNWLVTGVRLGELLHAPPPSSPPSASPGLVGRRQLGQRLCIALIVGDRVNLTA
eukprot:CAMPEP_0205914670 /NCGR_PEP_ID=MMETSP1325-20131115/7370_1 /ASSEMBLY_ACC=CAM_ASM_000708 /TAXON_ID=236786 /ORGANISM="Florenciella sp., Strain RCC1007" /LENGTH=76 /DNA_ID=CAMNT_0053281745 /DNA_START=37 /DNA_END=267 /DNA_ORIENTATION=-